MLDGKAVLTCANRVESAKVILAFLALSSATTFVTSSGREELDLVFAFLGSIVGLAFEAQTMGTECWV